MCTCEHTRVHTPCAQTWLRPGVLADRRPSGRALQPPSACGPPSFPARQPLCRLTPPTLPREAGLPARVQDSGRVSEPVGLAPAGWPCCSLWPHFSCVVISPPVLSDLVFICECVAHLYASKSKSSSKRWFRKTIAPSVSRSLPLPQPQVGTRAVAPGLLCMGGRKGIRVCVLGSRSACGGLTPRVSLLSHQAGHRSLRPPPAAFTPSCRAVHGFPAFAELGRWWGLAAGRGAGAAAVYLPASCHAPRRACWTEGRGGPCRPMVFRALGSAARGGGEAALR